MECNIKYTKEDCPKTLANQTHMSTIPYTQDVDNLMHAIVYTCLNYDYVVSNLS
jgi:hypothetical protein